MKIKTSELIGPKLDWAVAQCEMMCGDYRDSGLLVHRIGHGMPMPPYSTNWAQGGPIIEHMSKGTFFFMENDGKNCHVAYSETNHDNAHGYGPTLLIAAMRCYVASKLGDEVEVPDELVGE